MEYYYNTKKKIFGLAKCGKCYKLSSFIHLALWTDGTLRCPNCFNIADVVNIPKSYIVKFNREKLNHQKPIAIIVLDGLYIAGAQRHSLLLIESFKKLNVDSVVVAIEGGGIWASKFIINANCTIIGTKFHPLKWIDIEKVLGFAASRISFVSAHLVEPIKWCLHNVPRGNKIFAHLHSEPSEHEIVSESFLLKMSERSNRILFPSLATMEVYKNLYKTLTSFNKFRVLNNGLLKVNYSYGKSNYNENLCLKIAVISRIDDDKFSIPLFTKTIRKLINHIPNFKVVIAGDGEKMAELYNNIEREQLHGFVELKGFVYEIEEIYKWAHVVFLPSKRESMPYVMLEALSYGLPIIIPNTGFVKNNKEESNVFVYECENSEDAVLQFRAVEMILRNRENGKVITETYNWVDDVKSQYEIGM